MAEAIDLSELNAEEKPDVSFEEAVKSAEPPAPVPGGIIDGQLFCVSINHSDGVLIVDKLQSWGYTPVGVYAAGYALADADKTEVDVLIPWSKINYVKFDYEGTDKLVNELREKKDAGESPSD